jgi:hypothetical protein
MKRFLSFLLAVLVLVRPVFGLAIPFSGLALVPKPVAKQQATLTPIEDLLPTDTLVLIVTPQLSTLLAGFQQLEAFNLLDAQARLLQSSRAGGRREQATAPVETLKFLSFGIHDRKVLDQSRVGFALLKPPGVQPKPGAQPARAEPFFAAFIESPTNELAMEARREFLAYFSETFEDLGDLEKPRITPPKVENFKNGYAGVMIGLTYVLGDTAAINTILTLHASRDDLRLSDDPDFLRARLQLGGVGRVFGYLSGSAWTRYVNENFGAEVASSSEALGLLIDEPLRSLALASEFTTDGVIDRAVVSFDSSKRSLFSTLLSGPSIKAKAATLVPAGTGIFVSASLDPVRFYDEMFGPFMATTFANQGTRTTLASVPGSAPGSSRESGATHETSWRDASAERVNEWTATLKAKTGIDLRDQLSKNLGGEFSAALDIPLGARGVVGSTVTGTAFFIALKDPGAARALVEKHGLELWENIDVAPAGGTSGTPAAPIDAGEKAARSAGFIASLPRETYKEIDVWSIGDAFTGVSFCWLDDYLVLADSAEAIKRVIDTSSGAASMTIEEKYRRAMSRLTESANAQIYLGPRYFLDLLDAFQQGWSGRSASQVLPSLSPSFPATLAAEIENDGQVLKLTALSPVGVLGLIATSMVGDRLRSRTIANEAEALNNVRQIVEAQRAYAAAHGFYGSLEELGAAKLTIFDFKKLSSGGAYRYRVKVKADKRGYEATATPADYGPSARLSFYTDTSGRIRRADKNGAEATSSDEMIPLVQDKKD